MSNNNRKYHVTSVLNLKEKYALRYWFAKITAEYFKNNLIDKLTSGEMTAEDVKAIDDKQFIKDAKAEADRIAKEEANKGKRVHALAEAMFQQMLDNEDVEIEVESDIKEPFEQLVEIVKEHKMMPIDVEHEVEYDQEPYYYKGKTDYLGYYDNVIVVADLKTTSGIWDDHPLQLGAYWLALREEIKKNPKFKGIRLAGGLIIRLDKYTGEPEIKFYPNTEMQDYASEFLLWDAIYIKRKERKKLRKQRKKQAKEEAF